MTETGMITSNPLDGVRVGGNGRPPAARHLGARRRRRRRAVRAGRRRRRRGARARTCSPATGSMPEKTREEFTADGWFRTGDVGEWVADGEAKDYLRLVGRAKDLIISGGLNVYPKEIEERLDALPGVVESAVIGVPRPGLRRGGHRGRRRRGRASASTSATMIRSLKGEIATFKVPKRVHVVAELPRNAMGKVQKNVLRERFS